MSLKGKLQLYAEGRAAGMDPQTAGAHAGYAPGPGLTVAVSRNEARADVQKEIKRLRNSGLDKTETGKKGSAKDTRDAWLMKTHYDDPLDLLMDVMNNPEAPKSLRYQAAKDALPYKHARVAEAGKKEKKQEAAEKASRGGKFQRKSAPARVVMN